MLAMMTLGFFLCAFGSGRKFSCMIFVADRKAVAMLATVVVGGFGERVSEAGVTIEALAGELVSCIRASTDTRFVVRLRVWTLRS